MKKFKKIAALLLAMVMALAMAVPAMAATEATITVESQEAGALVKYTQIVEQDPTGTVKDSSGKSLGWKLVDSIESAFINGWNGTTDPAGTDTEANIIEALIALGKLENTENANVKAGKSNTAADADKYASALKAVESYATTEAGTTALSDSKNIVSFMLDKMGLYVVTMSQTGYAYLPLGVYVNTDYEGVAAVAKGSKTGSGKSINKDGYSVTGEEEVTYTVTAYYPYYDATATEKTFVIEDTLTNGTFEVNTLVVKAGETTLVAGTDYVVTWGLEGESDKTTVEIDFTDKYNADYAGKTVTVEYKVKADKTVLYEDSLGNGAVVYTANKEGVKSGTENIVNSCTTKITVNKVDAENTETKLSGAVFTLYEVVDAATAYDSDKKALKDGYVLMEGTLGADDAVYGVATGYTGTTDSTGAVTIDGIDAGHQYYLKETTAPSGYSLNDTYYKLTNPKIKEAEKKINRTEGSGDSAVTITGTETTYSVDALNIVNDTTSTVTDTELTALPSTGGIGTTIFTVAGCMIMIAAGGMLIVSRRRRNA